VDGKVEQDQLQEYRADEFVVATPHCRLVMGYLEPWAAVRAEAPELGLTLVHLTDVTAATDHLKRLRGAAARPAGAPEAPRRLPLDDFLTELRGLFEDQCDHWAPTLAKNRVVRGIKLFPYPSGGGEGDPTHPDGGLPPDVGDATAGHGTRVMILDTPIYPLESLAGRYLASRHSLLHPSNGPRNRMAGHATFIAGLVTRRAPATHLHVESVLDSDAGEADLWTVARRMMRYADGGVDVLNLSFGCFTFDRKPPLVLERAVTRLAPRMVIVAAGGNYGDAAADGANRIDPRPNTPIWPAAFDEVVAVGACDADGNVAPFTPKVRWLDFFAPGVNLTSTYLRGSVRGRDGKVLHKPFEGEAVWSGTSFAAAVVSGAVAAGTVPGRRSAHEALDELRRGVAGRSGAGIVPVPPTWPE